MAAMAPLVSARPLRPSNAVQRSAFTDSATLTLPQRERESAQGGPELPLSAAGEDQHTQDVDASEGPSLTFVQRQTERAATVTGRQRATDDAPGEFHVTRAAEQRPLTLAPSRGFGVQRAAQA